MMAWVREHKATRSHSHALCELFNWGPSRIVIEGAAFGVGGKCLNSAQRGLARVVISDDGKPALRGWAEFQLQSHFPVR